MDHSTTFGRGPLAPSTTRAARGNAIAQWWATRQSRKPARLNVALQGGGAHGAFTWGVLDALLQQPSIEFEGLSGSSAGAMNAVLLADGWLKGGRDGARRALADFWSAVGRQLPPALVSQRDSDDIDLSPAGRLLTAWAGQFAPTQFNPLDLNPLRDLLERHVDFERLRAASPFKLFVGATHARSGKLRLFREHELSVDVMLASACLPKLHHAVEIDGEAYWDGGYSANPAVFPLFYECESRDVLLVLLATAPQTAAPRSVEEIEARVAELAFSAHFMREMRMFAQASQFVGSGWFSQGTIGRRLREMRFHLIDASDVASMERTRTKILAYGPFLERLREQGAERGAAWLASHAADIGRVSTIDVAERFA